MKAHLPYDRVLWDFNCTILDDLGHGIEAINVLLRRRGLPTVDTPERYYAVFGFPIVDYYRRLGLLEKESYATLADEWIAEYRRDEARIPARPGAVALIRRLAAAGLPQSVLSATESSMLRCQLAYLGLSDAFDEIIGRQDIYAPSKLAVALAWRQRHSDERVICIGDTDHDFECAAACGMDCVLVEGGHQSPERLRSLGCPVLHDLDELEAYLFGDPV
ncbi:MAG: HAD family hydrolase [Clostridia bacterium]|nr:HAD family hydrolase [Clostridia bacterium]